VEAGLQYYDIIAVDEAHQAMLAIDSSTPTAH
jgi:hypothetical protein